MRDDLISMGLITRSLRDCLIDSSRYSAAWGEVLHSKKCVTLRDSYFDKDKQRNATIGITPRDCGFG